MGGKKNGIIDGSYAMDLHDGSILDEATGSIDLPPGQALQFKEINKWGGWNGNVNSGSDDIVNDGGNKGKSLFDRNRHLATGKKSVLVVRVKAANSETTDSELRLSDSVFGNGFDGSTDPVTLRSQYKACSYGQLEFEEAENKDGTNINIRNGTSYVHMLYSFSLIPTTLSHSHI